MTAAVITAAASPATMHHEGFTHEDRAILGDRFLELWAQGLQGHSVGGI